MKRDLGLGGRLGKTMPHINLFVFALFYSWASLTALFGGQGHNISCCE